MLRVGPYRSVQREGDGMGQVTDERYESIVFGNIEQDSSGVKSPNQGQKPSEMGWCRGCGGYDGPRRAGEEIGTSGPHSALLRASHRVPADETAAEQAVAFSDDLCFNAAEISYQCVRADEWCDALQQVAQHAYRHSEEDHFGIADGIGKLLRSQVNRSAQNCRL